MMMQIPASWLALLAAATLAACSATPLRTQGPALFEDAAFRPSKTVVTAADLFTLTPEMRRYADTEIRSAMRTQQPERALIDALYQSGQLKLEYDAEVTRTAAEAFASRSGNCLSLVIMTGAFAQYLGLPIRYQEVLGASSWSRSGQLVLASKHVNLSLTRQPTPGRMSNAEAATVELTIDFLPSEDVAHARTRGVSEATIRAMFFNNRAAEQLAQGDTDAAYWWVREAIRQVPAFTDSYNLLGVVYRQHGNADAAARTLRHALALEPDNAIVLSNLIGVLKVQGQHEEAQRLGIELARIEPYPPFHHYDLGMAALKAGDFAAARELFQLELRRTAHEPDSHFWLGIANLYLGDRQEADRQWTQAIEYSTTHRSRALYAAKLDWLKEQGYEQDRATRLGPRRS